jgi:hypothetical protein
VHFDYQPVLKGELVELRPLRADDYGALFAVALDATYARSGDLIGSSRYHGYDAKQERDRDRLVFSGEVPLGRHVHTYNGEMKRLMLTHDFRFVDRVVLLVGPDTLRSQRAVEKNRWYAGGVEAGRGWPRELRL